MSGMAKKLSLKSWFYYTIKRISNKQQRHRYEKYFEKHIHRFTECDSLKSTGLIKKEMRTLSKYWGTYPFQYFRYNFYRKDCQLTIDEMKEYVPEYFAYYLFFPKHFKDRNVLCEDKLLTYAIAKGLNIAQPELLFSTSNNVVYSNELSQISISSALELVENSESKSLFVKPTFGVGGKGIFVFNKVDDGYFMNNNGEIFNEEFITSVISSDYIVQEGLAQHDIMKSIYSRSVNTFRIVTECHNNNVKIPFALLRMGCGGSQIDNASSGGVYCGINPDSGKLSQFAFSDNGGRYKNHPDSGFQFEGYQLPIWAELVSFATSIAIKFSHIRYLGWDIAYTVNGPVIIEVNNGPSIEIIQDHFGGIRKQLGIENPKDYWFSTNYALKDL